MAAMQEKTETLYSVWRNNGDRLLILDGTEEQCAEALGIKLLSFRRLRYRAKNDPKGSPYTIRETAIDDVIREEES